jgi:hypothetical protein
MTVGRETSGAATGKSRKAWDRPVFRKAWDRPELRKLDTSGAEGNFLTESDFPGL